MSAPAAINLANIAVSTFIVSPPISFLLAIAALITLSLFAKYAASPPSLALSCSAIAALISIPIS